ncbi:hypothetical protein J3R80_03815 [Aliiroseovarius sp. Z3]|uniref:hypothetical protein n=1 Tax=Aliiroseovarius sp. Z3 TaxID=2811402 RepID=UPI0023B35080|nr:hypothetical protein [Aliiroseovarius sp. Z3]MDE9449594.1 hypothetical protein [Aliiroseovarius sp. Z3]
MSYRLFNTLADHPIPSGVGDFRLLDREVVDAICEMGERSRFDKAVFVWVGFETTEVEYDRPAGAERDSHWPYWKLWKLVLAVSIQKCASVRFTSCVRMFRKTPTKRQRMDRDVYERMNELEAQHWWFAARRDVIETLIQRRANLPTDARKDAIRKLTDSDAPDDSMPPGWPNGLMRQIFGAERFLLGRVPFPIGLSLGAVLEKA